MSDFSHLRPKTKPEQHGPCSRVAYVYVLRSPHTGAVRYVGQSGAPWNRSHSARASAGPVEMWTRLLRLNGLCARPEAVAVVPAAQAAEAERAEIERQIRAGSDLLNLNRGRAGCVRGQRRRRAVMWHVPEHQLKRARHGLAKWRRQQYLGPFALLSCGHYSDTSANPDGEHVCYECAGINPYPSARAA